MTGKTISRQAVRQRAAALGAGGKPDPITEALNDSAADANVAALELAASEMRTAARAPQREEPLPAGAVRGRNGEVLTRKRTITTDNFYVPEEFKDPDWSYEWKAEEVLNQPQVAKQVQYAENGWRPIVVEPGSRWAGIFMPADYKGPIRRDGQILMERPKVLTDEAYIEERQKANRQMRNTRESLRLAMPTGFSQDHAGVAPKLNQTYERGPAPDKRTLISD